MEAISGLLSAFGLSTAAGLNAYLPLLTVGVLTRLGVIQLASPFDWLAHPIVLLIIAALAVLDFVGDKVPAADSVLHAVGVVIHPIAGAILFLSANSELGTVHPLLAGLAGVVLAGGTHLARASVRPVATAATGGTANPVLSLIEDGIALVVSVLAVLLPVLAALFVALLVFILWRTLPRLMRPWRERERAARLN
ncbi:MAG: DUF4126 domain-containing protein [Chloroflexaceae bacterium]|jgi:hypothetical protein|nr:DUF4126 domain-containing protein [Chloroflexaceae bacterium]